MKNMRARPVYEISFERAVDPKKSMGIGLLPKDPMPKLEQGIQQVRETPESVRLGDLVNLFRDTAEDIILITIRDGLIKEFGYPVQVVIPENRGLDPKIHMSLPSGHKIVIAPSGSRIHWHPILSDKDGDPIVVNRSSSSTLATLIKNIKKLIKENLKG
jgi:hypothetical protein